MKALMTYFPREIHEIFFQSILNSDTRQTKLKQRKVSAIRIALDNKWKPVFHWSLNNAFHITNQNKEGEKENPQMPTVYIAVHNRF